MLILASVYLLIYKGKEIIPVEVKAGTNVAARSLNLYIAEKKPKYVPPCLIS